MLNPKNPIQMADGAPKIACDKWNVLDTINFSLLWPIKLCKLSFNEFGWNYSIYKKILKDRLVILIKKGCPFAPQKGLNSSFFYKQGVSTLPSRILALADVLQTRPITAIQILKLDRKLVFSAPVLVGNIPEFPCCGFWRVNWRAGQTAWVRRQYYHSIILPISILTSDSFFVCCLCSWTAFFADQSASHYAF